MIRLTKQDARSSYWQPLEQGTITVRNPSVASLIVRDAAGRTYLEQPVRGGRAVRFIVRGTAGRHRFEVLDGHGVTIEHGGFTLKPRTRIQCNRGVYAKLAHRVELLLQRNEEQRGLVINGRLYRMLVTWGRDHVHTLKAQKYFMQDVQSGLDYWLETQEPNGMFRDCIHPNSEYPAPAWFGEALGEGYFWYDDGMRYVVRRIPVEADCEFLYTEGVWYAWKAGGDDEWMARQLPRLEKALKYNSSHPTRWSRRHGLVRRSMCMDSWDFVNPLFCRGDHRCINPGDPQFLFHSDNSGLYASYWRMAEMYEHLGNHRRASQLRRQGEALRARANRKLFFGSVYGHMIPETLDEKAFYAKVGDERKRMSLSTGYTINRRLPTHEMAVRIIREYQRRRELKRRESFAEWWTMDPPYEPHQWPQQGTGGSTVGDYMNGAICTIIAGEIAKAAFDHGCEDYGADILRRVWDLSEMDGGNIHQAYRRLPKPLPPPKAAFRFVDLRSVANRGLRYRATRGVEAWTGEGVNDLRLLPTGRRRFGVIEFDVIDPKANAGRAVLRIDPDPKIAPTQATIPVPNLKGRSLYFLHAMAHSAGPHAVVGLYDVTYEDGATRRIYVRNNHEIGLWWGINDKAVDRSVTRVAWQGPNGQWKNVGLFMNGWDNPHPDKAITAIRVQAVEAGGRGAGILLAGVSVSDSPVGFEERFRSYGLPDCWAQAAVYYAIAEGLAGLEDAGRAFSRAKVSPRWMITEATGAEVCLHYPASDGYCAYRYRHEPARRRLVLDLTGSFDSADLHCLMPPGKKPARVTIDGTDVPFKAARVEKSVYADFTVPHLPRRPIVVDY
jgi:hypothetical protein